MSDNTERQDRDAIDELLPWHAAGTLSRREEAEVEKALNSRIASVDPLKLAETAIETALQRMRGRV